MRCSFSETHHLVFSFLYIYYYLMIIQVISNAAKTIANCCPTQVYCRDTYRYHMMHRVDITVTHVDPNGLKGEAVLLPWGVNDNRWLQAAGAEWQVAAGGGVTRRRVGGQGVRGDGAGLEAPGRVIWNIRQFPSEHVGRTVSCPLPQNGVQVFTCITCCDDNHVYLLWWWETGLRQRQTWEPSLRMEASVCLASPTGYRNVVGQPGPWEMSVWPRCCCFESLSSEGLRQRPQLQETYVRKGETWKYAEAEAEILKCRSEVTFIICGEGKTRHRLQAVCAAHHQRTGAPLRLGGAGGGPRAKAANSQTPEWQVTQLVRTGVQVITRQHSHVFWGLSACCCYIRFFIWQV